MRSDNVAVWWDPASEGITSKSLRNLRTALVEAYYKPTVVVMVETSDITCGFLVVVHNPLVNFAGMGLGSLGLRATWTGDGFRLDEGGEGGAGMRAARKLLDLFGHSTHLVMAEPWCWSPPSITPDHDPYAEIERAKYRSLCEHAKETIEALSPDDFRRSADIPPQY